MKIKCRHCGEIKDFYSNGLCENCFITNGDSYNKNVQGIYKITNIRNAKVYIGQALKTEGNIFSRWKYGHIWALKNNRHVNSHLQKAYNKYGIDSFIFEVVEECYDSNVINNREIYWIAYYGSNDREKGYNLTMGGEGTRGYIYTEEHRRKVSENNRGENNNKATITEIMAESIKVELIKNNGKVKETANKFNLKEDIIQNIKSLITWSFVREDLNEQLRNMVNDRSYIDENIASQIKIALVENKGSIKAVSEELNIERSKVSSIKTLQSWKHINPELNDILRNFVSVDLSEDMVLLIKSNLIKENGSIEKVCDLLDVEKYDVANIKYFKNYIDIGSEYNEKLKKLTKKLNRYQFTHQDLIDIRDKYKNGTLQKDLAIEYGCSYVTISYIVNYKGKYKKV